MTRTTQLMSAVGISLLLQACAAFATTADPAAVIESAKVAHKKAVSVGGEWRDTGMLLKGAEKALEAGDKDAALSLAREALQQSELGYEQAMAQKDAGPRF